MTMVLKQEDMDKNLDAILPEGETYKVKIWGLILKGSTLERFILDSWAVLQNECCYFGITEKHLVIALMGSMNISKMQGKIIIPLDELPPVKRKHGVLPNQKMLILGEGKGKLKISLMDRSVLTSSIKNQREEIQTFCELLGV